MDHVLKITVSRLKQRPESLQNDQLNTGNPAECNWIYRENNSIEKWCWSVCTSHLSCIYQHWYRVGERFRGSDRCLQPQTSQTDLLLHREPCIGRFSCRSHLYSILHRVFAHPGVVHVKCVVRVARVFHFTESKRLSHDTLFSERRSVSCDNRSFKVRLKQMLLQLIVDSKSLCQKKKKTRNVKNEAINLTSVVFV